MIVATITEAKNKLSSLIDKVRAGESVLITDRGRPVARLESPVSAEENVEGRLLRLERTGIVRIGAGKTVDEILSSEPTTAANKASALRALLEERDQGR